MWPAWCDRGWCCWNAMQTGLFLDIQDFLKIFRCYFFHVFTSTSFFSSTAARVVSQFVSKNRAWIELHRWYKNAWMLLKKACIFQASYPEFSLVCTGNPIIGIYWNAKLFPITVASEGLLEPHTKNATILLVTVTGWGSTPNSIHIHYIYIYLWLDHILHDFHDFGTVVLNMYIYIVHNMCIQYTSSCRFHMASFWGLMRRTAIEDVNAGCRCCFFTL